MTFSIIARMRVGIVDVGSNTARLLVADVLSSRNVRTVEARKVHLGLGAELADTGTLSASTVTSTGSACRRLARHALDLGARRAEVIVTSPGRHNAASDALLGAIRGAAGIPAWALSADEEGASMRKQCRRCSPVLRVV